MKFLYSNYPPMKTRSDSFAEAFYDYASRSKKIDIAVGYVTSDSLAELQKLAELNEDRTINLIIGMHYYDLFTRVEYNVASELNRFLLEQARGGDSYARRRDSMGRYTSRRGGMSYDDGMVEELRDLMDRAPDEPTRREFHKLITKLEQR